MSTDTVRPAQVAGTSTDTPQRPEVAVVAWMGCPRTKENINDE